MPTPFPRSPSANQLEQTISIPQADLEYTDQAIKKNDLAKFKQFLRHYPTLLDYPLNTAKQTALMLSIQYGAIMISDYLLLAGADRDITDKNNHNALDHASFKENAALVEHLKTQVSLQPLFHQLKQFIHQTAELHRGNKSINNILDAILSQLNKLDIASYQNCTAARQIDLYYAARGIAYAVHNARDDDSLIANVRKFFAAREHILATDDHDYCWNATLANQLCRDVANILSQGIEGAPLSILLPHSLDFARLKKPPTYEMFAGSIFKATAPYLLQLPHSTLQKLEYDFFNMPFVFFDLPVTADDLALVKKTPPAILNLIFEHPQLIPLNPKLALFTAILFNNQNTTENKFFNELRKYLHQKEFISTAIQLLTLSVKNESGMSLPMWVRGLCHLADNFFEQLVIQVAQNKQWHLLWRILHTRLPEAAVMEKILQYVINDSQPDALIQWRHLAASQPGPRELITNYWKKALKEPVLLTTDIMLVLNHVGLPELKKVFLSANTDKAWHCMVEYVKTRMWGAPEKKFISKLLKKALNFDVYVAIQMLKPMQKFFEDVVPSSEKKLAQELITYCENRVAKKSESGYFPYSIWGRLHGMNEQTKLTAAIKKLLSLVRDDIKYTPKEHHALHDSHLGMVVWWHTPTESPRRLAN